jgi:hypothetical protein
MLTIETAKVFQALLAPSVTPMRSLGDWSASQVPLDNWVAQLLPLGEIF